MPKIVAITARSTKIKRPRSSGKFGSPVEVMI